MIDTDDTRDYAEERAVRSEQNAERASETAHERLVGETVRHLRKLGADAHDDARATVLALRDDVELRQAPNVHRYELLARQQHLAYLAPFVAAHLEATGSYDLASVADTAVRAYRATHEDPLGGRRSRAVLAIVGERILDAVAEVANYALQAETDREVELHERDLAERDA